MIIQSRRGFITRLVSLLAAPAIVRAGSLMPVKAIDFGVRVGGITEFYEGRVSYILSYIEHLDGLIEETDHITGIKKLWYPSHQSN